MDAINIKYYVDEDKWYKYKGVKPPERQSHGVTEDNVEELIKLQNDHAHKWIQQGNYIKCFEGKNEHGKNIGVYKRLTGTNKDGSPILVDI